MIKLRPECPCDERVAEPCYEELAKRCACYDPCCKCLPYQPLWMKCGYCEDSATAYPCISSHPDYDGNGEDEGLGDGPTYGACRTLCGHQLCVNWFCKDGSWKARIWIDGEFCEEVDLGPPQRDACGNLIIGTGSSNCLTDCCIGVGEECFPPECCEDTSSNEYIYASGGGRTITFKNSSFGSHRWDQQSGDVFPGQMTPYYIECANGVWFLGACPSCPITLEGSCDPVVNFTFTLDGILYTVTQ